MSVAPDRLESGWAADVAARTGSPAFSAIVNEFPSLRREFNGRRVTYLDSAATSQTPQVVIDAIVDYYTNHRASIDRGVYDLATEATGLFEGARRRIADWLGSTVPETIFTANASASLNLITQSWGRANLEPGDLVVLTEMEHHSDVVPWQLICAERGAELAYITVTEDGKLDEQSISELLARAPKVVAFSHLSNVLGTINPAAELTRRAHQAGAIVVIDGTQAVPQIPVDLREIDADFYVWSGHKVYGPTGVGVLHGRRELLEAMPPFIAGGHMIKQVFATSSTWTELPNKFEAGTSAVAEVIGLGAAVEFVQGIGISAIRAHELDLTRELLARFEQIDGLSIHGTHVAEERGGLVSFGLDGVHPHDVGEILNREAVCVRTGHHCAQPLMRRFGWSATTRASFGVYNSAPDIDRLIDGIHAVQRVFGD
jgi:cysteine desulfurase/selenocysteine lyase